MPECVWIDVRKIVFLAEFRQPVCHAVRVHGLSVILREYEALIVVVFTKAQPFGVLPHLILTQ